MVRGRSKETLHHHGCIECRRRYSCGLDKCEADARCNVCVSGIPSILAEGWEPRPCCYDNIPLPEMYTAVERKPYKLFGTPWFKCPTCHRQFPCQPDLVKVERR